MINRVNVFKNVLWRLNYYIIQQAYLCFYFPPCILLSAYLMSVSLIKSINAMFRVFLIKLHCIKMKASLVSLTTFEKNTCLFALFVSHSSEGCLHTLQVAVR